MVECGFVRMVDYICFFEVVDVVFGFVVGGCVIVGLGEGIWCV